VSRYWKDRFVTTLNPLPGTRILDVAGGTGDIAFRCLDRMKSTSTFFSKAPAGNLCSPSKTFTCMHACMHSRSIVFACS
jgi:hypothetical protein